MSTEAFCKNFEFDQSIQNVKKPLYPREDTAANPQEERQRLY
jgi:hypothetical protein